MEFLRERPKLISLGGWLLSALVCLLLLSAVFRHAQALSVSSGRDCNDGNAVLDCGALTTAELQQKYHGTGVVGIFNRFGITSSDISNIDNNAVACEVFKNGDVKVNGQLVATDAITAGRQDKAGSTKVMAGGVAFYERPPSVSFASSPLSSFCVMKNGQFAFAIIASCGNPVRATPVKKTTPQPAPAMAPISIAKVVKDTNGQQLSAVPANVFVFDVTCDGVSRTVTYSQSPMPAGNCKVGGAVTITERSTSGWRTLSSSAQSFTVAKSGVQVTFENQQIPAPTPPQVKTNVTPPAPSPQPQPQQIVNTGPAQVVGLGLLATTAGTAGHYLYLRRRNL